MEKIKKVENEFSYSQKCSIRDAGYASASSGAGEHYINACAVALNSTPIQLGLLSSVPGLFAPLAQLFTSRVMGRFSRSRIVGSAVLLQALMWIPLALTAFFGFRGLVFAPVLLIAFYSLYAVFGNFAAPAWSSWVGDIVEKEKMSLFIGRRNKIASITALIAAIAAGLIIQSFSGAGMALLGFVVTFIAAMILRLRSRAWLLRQDEPKFIKKSESYFSFFDFLREAPWRAFGRLSLGHSLMVFSTNIVAPFYTAYALRNLGFSYIQIAAIQVASGLSSIIFSGFWARFTHLFGSIYAIKVASYLMPMLCFLWPLSEFLPGYLSFPLIIGVNFFAAFSWSGFNIAAQNYLYDAAAPEKRHLCSAYSNVLNGVGVFAGSMIGSIIVSNVKVPFMNIIMFVSVLSGIARYLVSFIVIRDLKEVREVEEKPALRELPMINQFFGISSAVADIGTSPVHLFTRTLGKTADFLRGRKKGED